MDEATKHMTKQMMRKILLVMAVLAAAAVAFTEAARGTPEIAEKEKQGCMVCHVAVGPAELNDRGKYYKEERTLEGYEAPEPEEETPAPEPQPEDRRPD